MGRGRGRKSLTTLAESVEKKRGPQRKISPDDILRQRLWSLYKSVFDYTVSTVDPLYNEPGQVAQSVGHLTRKSGVPCSIPGLATYFRFSFRFLKKGSFSYLRKYVHEVLVNRLGGLSLPRKSVVRLTDRPDMTLDVYRGRKTTIQQQYNLYNDSICSQNF